MVTIKPLFFLALPFIGMAGSGGSEARGGSPEDGQVMKPQVQTAGSGALTGKVTVNKELYNFNDLSVLLFDSGWRQLGKYPNMVRVSADRIDYSFPEVSPGQYYVKFFLSIQDRNPPNYYHHFERYYPDSPTKAGATPIAKWLATAAYRKLPSGRICRGAGAAASRASKISRRK